ncbi:32299_t:CDS:2 [Gigaspora margarita]|uniref:32299_t:CDS:1 n=1 Tax=Gigaspora margarita TaxID=4874 RepID=A0ABN7V6X7_GIGMA|nr:32299_t:CDS:2 [Gigaspora margarita]
MPKMKGFQIQGQKIILYKLCHCVHCNKVRQKQKNYILKKPYSLRARNIGYMTSIHLQLEQSLNFWRIKNKICNTYLELYSHRHSLATALCAYKYSLYLQANSKKKLIQLLADCRQNPNYEYILHLFEQYRDNYLGGQNSLCAGALPLGIIIILDELEITLKKGLDFLKELFLLYAFFEHGPDIGPQIFLTDDSSANNSLSQEISELPEFHKLTINKNILTNNALPQEISKIQELQEPDIDNIVVAEHNLAFFDSFLKTIKNNYENSLIFFLYDVNCNTDPHVCIRSGAKICIQVESVKCKKTIKDKENNSHVIPVCKVQAVGKKMHSLSKNINKNQLN